MPFISGTQFWLIICGYMQSACSRKSDKKEQQSTYFLYRAGLKMWTILQASKGLCLIHTKDWFTNGPHQVNLVLIAYASSEGSGEPVHESRGTLRQKARSLAPLNGWACAVKICNDGMLEDTNSLDAAQMVFDGADKNQEGQTWFLMEQTRIKRVRHGFWWSRQESRGSDMVFDGADKNQEGQTWFLMEQTRMRVRHGFWWSRQESRGSDMVFDGADKNQEGQTWFLMEQTRIKRVRHGFWWSRQESRGSADKNQEGQTWFWWSRQESRGSDMVFDGADKNQEGQTWFLMEQTRIKRVRHGFWWSRQESRGSDMVFDGADKNQEGQTWFLMEQTRIKRVRHGFWWSRQESRGSDMVFDGADKNQEGQTNPRNTWCF